MKLILHVRNGTRGKFEKVTTFEDTAKGRDECLSFIVFLNDQDKLTKLERTGK